MIISNVVGGLGNQMFQYACGRAVSNRVKLPFKIAIDQFSEYRDHNGLELLNVFDLDVKIATKQEMQSLLRWQSSVKIRRLLGRREMSWATGRAWCNEPYFDYWPGIRNIQGPAYLHGYWQSEKYFEEVSDVIRREFTFCKAMTSRDLVLLEKMAAGPCVSLHIRRGDYLSSKNVRKYAYCDASYYINSVMYLRERIPNIKLFGFSDDPVWVENYLQPLIGKIEVVSHNTGEKSANDMRLMSSTDHHIIANSSFSWWAAWLNQSKEKIVITPKSWFADGRPTPSLFPNSWIHI